MSDTEGELSIDEHKMNDTNVNTISDSDEEEEGEVFEVERILEMKMKHGGKREFKVRWKNYGPDDDSWEPEENLSGAKQVLEAFLADNPQMSEKKKPAAPKSAKNKKRLAKSQEDDDTITNTDVDSDGDDQFELPSKKKVKHEKASNKKKNALKKTTSRIGSTSNSRVSPNQFGTKMPAQQQSTLVGMENWLMEQTRKPPLLHSPCTARIISKESYPKLWQEKAVNQRLELQKHMSWLDSDDEEQLQEEANNNADGKKDGNNDSVAGTPTPVNQPTVEEVRMENGNDKQEQVKNTDSDATNSPPPPVDPDATSKITTSSRICTSTGGKEPFSDHDAINVDVLPTSSSRIGSRLAKRTRDKSATITPVANANVESVTPVKTRKQIVDQDKLLATPIVHETLSNAGSEEELVINAIVRDHLGGLQLLTRRGELVTISKEIETKMASWLKNELNA